MGAVFKGLFALLCLPLLVTARTDFSAWKDSTRIFINTSSTGANMTPAVGQFPLLVRLDSNSASFAKMLPAGADIRFADPDGTLLPHEIESFDAAAKTCVAWVRVPAIDALSQSDYIVLFWNNPAAQSSSNSSAVFDTALGYAGIWHFGEEHTGTGTIGLYRDATRNGNHGDDFATESRSALFIAGGQEFDGVDDYIRVPNTASMALPGPLSISAWVQADWLALNAIGGSTANPIVRKGDDNPNSYQLGVINNRVFCSLDADDNGGVKSKSELVTGKVYHVAATWDARSLKVYVNGVLEGEGYTPNPAGSLTKDTRPVYIGGRVIGTSAESKDRWDGNIDEVRISRVAHTPQHYKLSYENQKPGSTILTFKPFPPAAPVTENLQLWPKSRRIFFNTWTDGAAVAGAVTDFPMLVRLDTAIFNFGEAAVGGADLRFADVDGVTILPHSIERWDAAAGKAEIWVKVPKVDGGSKTDFIRMYWGVPAAVDNQKPESVFDTADGFAGVWHLDRGASGRTATPAYGDQTWNRNHALDYAMPDPSGALIGKGQGFASDLDRLEVTSNPGLDFTTSLTFSAWIKATAWDTGESKVNTVIRKGEGNPNTYQLAVSDGHLTLYLDQQDNQGTPGITLLRTGEWYHVASAWGEGQIRLYVNGVLDLAAPVTRPAPIAKDTRAMYIGGRDNLGSGSDPFQGLLDEVEASRVARSADWIKLAYESQKPGGALLVHEGYENKIIPIDPPIDTLKPVIPIKPAWTYDTTLAPGTEFGKDGVFKIRNPGPGSVRVVITPAGDTVTAGVIGVEALIHIYPVIGGGTMPVMVLAMDSAAAGGRSVYQLLPGVNGSGTIGDWGGAAAARDLPYPGYYIVAKDTTAPRLRIVDQGVTDTDSSWILVLAEDNIKHVLIKCYPIGALGESAFGRTELAGVPFRISLKPEPGLAPLKVTLSVGDSRKTTVFPPAPAKDYTLVRSLPDFDAPLAAKSGLNWSLYGLPVQPRSKMTLEELAAGSGAGMLHGATWIPDTRDSVKGAYRMLEGKDTLPSGTGLWLAGEKPFASLRLGSARSLSQGTGAGFTITLRRGWNQITSPSLEKLPWPISNRDLPTKDLSLVKGLHGYAGEGMYGDVDSLEPWKGYFVFSKVDTVLDLAPVSPVTPKPAAGRLWAMAPFIHIVLEPIPGRDGALGAAACLRLGASGYAVDGLGIEDEPMPLSPIRTFTLAAARGGRSLRTDLIGYRDGSTHVWKLVWAGSRNRLPESARFRVAALHLPEGMSLWAASPLARHALPLTLESALEILGDEADTLVIWAAPTGSWREGDPVPGLAPRPALRSVAFAAGPEGWELHVDQPDVSGLRAAVHTADGRCMALLERARLAPGRHVLRLAQTGSAPRGLLLVTVDFPGLPGRTRMILKSVLP